MYDTAGRFSGNIPLSPEAIAFAVNTECPTKSVRFRAAGTPRKTATVRARLAPGTSHDRLRASNCLAQAHGDMPRSHGITRVSPASPPATPTPARPARYSRVIHGKWWSNGFAWDR